jgi:hypothetical protein
MVHARHVTNPGREKEKEKEEEGGKRHLSQAVWADRQGPHALFLGSTSKHWSAFPTPTQRLHGRCL